MSVLDALRPIHHVEISAGCHNGGCGVCKIRIVKGDYATGPMSRAHVSADAVTRNEALACRTYPVNDLTVEVIGKLPAKMIRKYGFLTN